MSNELKVKLDRFMSGVRENPPIAAMNEFLHELSSDGQLFDYSEHDWIEAGRSYGLTDDEISNWIETAASWIQDTTEDGKTAPEKAVWG